MTDILEQHNAIIFKVDAARDYQCTDDLAALVVIDCCCKQWICLKMFYKGLNSVNSKKLENVFLGMDYKRVGPLNSYTLLMFSCLWDQNMF